MMGQVSVCTVLKCFNILPCQQRVISLLDTASLFMKPLLYRDQLSSKLTSVCYGSYMCRHKRVYSYNPSILHDEYVYVIFLFICSRVNYSVCGQWPVPKNAQLCMLLACEAQGCGFESLPDSKICLFYESKLKSVFFLDRPYGINLAYVFINMELTWTMFLQIWN